MRNRFNHQKRSSINVKWSIIWILIYSISLFLVALLLQKLNINNKLLTLFFTGIGITIISRIIRIFTLKKRFIVDKWFLFWFLINTLTIWLIYIFVSLSKITNYFIILFLTALGIVVTTYFVKRLRLNRTRMIIASIIILVTLTFFNWNSSATSYHSDQITNFKSNSILFNIKDSFNNLISSKSVDTCPQLPLIMKKKGESSSVIYGKTGEQIIEECPDISISCIRIGPQYKPYNDIPFLTNSEWESPTNFILCRNAENLGESRSNIYCDKTNMFLEWSISSIPYIVKKESKSDIITGKNPIRKSFVNVYTKEGTFIKTICGPDPEEIIKKREEEAKSQFKQAMKEIDDFFTI